MSEEAFDTLLGIAGLEVPADRRAGVLRETRQLRAAMRLLRGERAHTVEPCTTFTLFRKP